MSRLFFALWPPEETASALHAWAGTLEGRITEKGKIHLTLAFLGGVQPEKALLAARRVKGEAFELPIDSAQHVKDMLWVGPREMPAGLKALVDALHLALYRAEFILERRPFAAHVTLARKAPRPKALPPLPKVEWPVRDFALMDSDFSRYELLERFRLES